MKINFDGTYKDVSRLLQAPRYGSVEAVAFEKTLGSISPDRSKPLISQVKSASVDNSGSTSEGRMASMRQDFPEQILPPVDHIIEEVPVPDAPDGVKSPTLVGVHRVKVPEMQTATPEPPSVKDDLRKLISAAGEKHGVDPALGMAVAKAESDFNPKAISRDGHDSKGLFQLLDSTGKQLMERLDMKSVYDPYDPQMNVELGVSYLRYLHDIFSAPTKLANTHSTSAAANSASLEKLAVAAFNAGEGRVASAQGRAEAAGKDPSFYEDVAPYLPSTTQQYVQKVMNSKAIF